MECRKHKHGRDKGVCPCCLRDKLSRVSSPKVPCVAQTRSPSCSASPAAADIHRRTGSMSFAVREALLTDFHGGLGLKKSRSMTFAPRDYVTTTAKKKSTTVKKVAFWRKLIPFRGEDEAGGSRGGLFHTRKRYHC